MTRALSVLALFTALTLGAQEGASLKLPAPETTGGATLLEALWGRKTDRALAAPALALTEASRLLWAAQGENRPGHRTVPSAHAKYMIDMVLITAGSATLPAGCYRYAPAGHQLINLGAGTPATLLGPIKGMQGWIAGAPNVFVVIGTPSRLGGDPESARSLTYYEGGAAAQDLLLQASALGLGAGTAVGIDLAAVAQAIKLPVGSLAMTVLPVGHLKK